MNIECPQRNVYRIYTWCKEKQYNKYPCTHHLLYKKEHQDFSGGAVAETPPGFSPWSGNQIFYATTARVRMLQLRYRMLQLRYRMLQRRPKIPSTITKTWRSQINKYSNKKIPLGKKRLSF